MVKLPPDFNKTVTIYRRVQGKDGMGRSETQWIPETVSGCFWTKVSANNFSDKERQTDDTFFVRLPVGSTVNKGDVLFLGEINDIVSDVQGLRMKDLRAKHELNCFEAMSVKVNDAIPFLAHIRVEGV